MAIFGNFFASCVFSEPRLRLGEEKQEEEQTTA